jgi:octaprenyl-diphosphate synthase
MAAGVEMLHTATLVHDDTVDDSAKRRGKPTASKMWGGGTAILAGDYMFSQAAEFVARTGNLRVIRLFARTLMTLCKGELDQIFSSFNHNQSRQSYFKRISNKTSSLFSTATESAGILSEAPEKAIQAMRSYGHDLGMAFQIVDDILDFTADEEKLGKPVASDLAQGTLTLPAILLNERYPKESPIAGLFRGEERQRSLELALEMIHDSDIIPECYSVARGFASEACQAAEAFPESSSRKALLRIADHVVSREM